MSYRSHNHLTRAGARRMFAGLILLGCIAAERANGAEITVEQQVSAAAVKAQRTDLNLVSHSLLIARGQTLGTVVIYDDPATRRPADYLEVYDLGGDLVALVWFDRFGIRRTVVDRALVEGGVELAGVLVSVLEGEPI